MAEVLTARLKLSFDATLENDQTIFESSVPISFSHTISLANGTAIDQADRIYYARRSVTSGVPDEIDLAGALTNPLGTTVTFAKIKLMVVANRSTTAANILEVGGDAAAVAAMFGAAPDTIKVAPGSTSNPVGFLALASPSLAGYAVTGTTADIIEFKAAAGTISYDVLIVGTSA
jgi:hypothetical protein